MTRRERLKELGLCRNGCNKPITADSSSCIDCVNKEKEARRQFKEQGLCTKRCGRQAVSDQIYCTECTASVKAKTQARHEKGICRCGQPARPGKKLCSSCALKSKQRSDAWKQLGLCSCGSEPLPERIKCEICTWKYLAWMHLNNSSRYIDLIKMYEEQDRKCAYTGLPIEVGANLDVDHIIPRSRGGETEALENLVLAHRIVNQVRRHLTIHEFAALCESFTKFYRTNVAEEIPTLQQFAIFAVSREPPGR